MKFGIFKKNEDGSLGELLATYIAEKKDDTSSNRSYLHAEPLASHLEIPEEVDEDCAVPLFVTEQEYIEAQEEKWTKLDGEILLESIVQPTIDDGTGTMVPDDSWTHVPAIQEVPFVPAHYIVVEDEILKAEKTATDAEELLSRKLDMAIAFGNDLMREFTKENMRLGITADGMTGTVRKAMVEVILACQTGSLHDAIAEAKAIPASIKDSKYITDARILAFINKIESYLGLPVSTTL